MHAKCDEVSRLFELSQEVLAALPEGSVDKAEDIYSFVYKNGRDLSGFIDGLFFDCVLFFIDRNLSLEIFPGTENAADDDDRRNIAVEKETGGSYVVSNIPVLLLKFLVSFTYM